jgi:hypothetical protein
MIILLVVIPATHDVPPPDRLLEGLDRRDVGLAPLGQSPPRGAVDHAIHSVPERVHRNKKGGGSEWDGKHRNEKENVGFRLGHGRIGQLGA